MEANVQSLRSQLAGSRDDVERLESALTESRKQQALLGEKSKQMASYEEKLASLRAEVQNTSKEKKKQAEQIRKLERSGREYLTWSQAKGEEIQCLKDDKKRLEKLLADALARAELAESIPPAPTESEDLGRKIRELELAYEQAEATNRAVTAREAAQVEELR